jgi:hypothetical protein
MIPHSPHKISAIRPYTESAESSPHPHILFHNIHCKNILNVKWDGGCDLHVMKDVNGIDRCLFPEFGWKN